MPDFELDTDTLKQAGSINQLEIKGNDPQGGYFMLETNTATVTGINSKTQGKCKR